MFQLVLHWHHDLLDITNDMVIATFTDPAVADGIAVSYLRKLDCGEAIQAVADATNFGAVSWWYLRTCEGEALVRLEREEQTYDQ